MLLPYLPSMFIYPLAQSRHWFIGRILTNILIAKIIKILGRENFIRLAKLIKLLSVKYLNLQN